MRRWQPSSTMCVCFHTSLTAACRFRESFKSSHYNGVPLYRVDILYSYRAWTTVVKNELQLPEKTHTHIHLLSTHYRKLGQDSATVRPLDRYFSIEAPIFNIIIFPVIADKTNNIDSSRKKKLSFSSIS